MAGPKDPSKFTKKELADLGKFIAKWKKEKKKKEKKDARKKRQSEYDRLRDVSNLDIQPTSNYQKRKVTRLTPKTREAALNFSKLMGMEEGKRSDNAQTYQTKRFTSFARSEDNIPDNSSLTSPHNYNVTKRGKAWDTSYEGFRGTAWRDQIYTSLEGESDPAHPRYYKGPAYNESVNILADNYDAALSSNAKDYFVEKDHGHMSTVKSPQRESKSIAFRQGDFPDIFSHTAGPDGVWSTEDDVYLHPIKKERADLMLEEVKSIVRERRRIRKKDRETEEKIMQKELTAEDFHQYITNRDKDRYKTDDEKEENKKKKKLKLKKEKEKHKRDIPKSKRARKILNKMSKRPENKWSKSQKKKYKEGSKELKKKMKKARQNKILDLYMKERKGRYLY